MTRPDDAVAAAEAGADAIGIVLQPGLARSVSPEAAKEIVWGLPPLVTAVGLFVDADADSMRRVAEVANLNCLQLHGHESSETIKALSPIAVFKAVHVDRESFAGELFRLGQAPGGGRPRGYVMDTAGGGGKGELNDWDTLHSQVVQGKLTGLFTYWIAAGGLTPQNVGDVVRRLRPWGVDVSSGVESIKGKKSPRLIERFIRAVRDADAEKD